MELKEYTGISKKYRFFKPESMAFSLFDRKLVH